MSLEHYYLAIVALLFVLAITDLVVGVSNDAVNFLNSSIGSKVASRNVIMTIAGLGIFAGAFFSSGMMEIARKGIFIPSYFSFEEVMIIFLAVMFTDIILLDFFNTLGMPTSTTVSIVFELIGASVMSAGLKLLSSDLPIQDVFDFINTSKALAIIGGIFLSVFFAFSLGTIIQYFTRMVFSFQLNQTKRWLKVFFFAVCLSTISYFLLFKGLSGASFVSQENLVYIMNNGLEISALSFVIWGVLGFVLSLLKVELLRVIVLFGTFSLAMSFAGNDLVNFIGVSIAGLESFQIWSSSGIDPSAFMMDDLGAPIRTNTFILLCAGLVMVVTLWFSKKAQSVTETEVKLGRQDAGEERFKPNRLSILLVDVFRVTNRHVSRWLPESFMNKVNARFTPLQETSMDKPAFDLVRASINLTLASLLISLATSLKLPLSTTYVSFMVAMGTSLADRAWGAESAANRIAGVSNVVGGWFLTAMIAFIVAAIFTVLLRYGGAFAVIGLTALVFYSILRTYQWHKRKLKED